MNLVFFRLRYAIESGGALGVYYNELTDEPVDYDDINFELMEGGEVRIRPATPAEIARMEATLSIYKARVSSAVICESEASGGRAETSRGAPASCSSDVEQNRFGEH